MADPPEGGRADLAPLPGAPALVLTPAGGSGGLLIVADLHLGLGGTPRWPAGPPEGSASGLGEALLRDAERAGVRRIVIAGDVKHPIVGTPPPLRPVLFRFFSDLLSRGLEIDVVLGNHDVGLVPHLPREVRVHGAEGILLHGVGVFHGHRWPSPEVRGAERVVVGHLHPGFRFAPTSREASAKSRCWLRTTYPDAPPVPPAPGRRPPRRFTARETIVLPAYHPLAGTEALNRAAPSRGRSFLFGRLLAGGAGRLYLLDGTDLGALRLPRPDRPKRSRPRGGPGR